VPTTSTAEALAGPLGEAEDLLVALDRPLLFTRDAGGHPQHEKYVEPDVRKSGDDATSRPRSSVAIAPGRLPAYISAAPEM
jgi:hypothetical protein